MKLLLYYTIKFKRKKLQIIYMDMYIYLHAYRENKTVCTKRREYYEVTQIEAAVSTGGLQYFST